MSAASSGHITAATQNEFASPTSRCPYVGLRPYTEAERDLFYGRHADSKRLVDKIFSGRLTLLYGPSGVGKTSLLQARVIPDLKDPAIGDAIVVVFEAWGEPDVEAAIKREIGKAIGAAASGLAATEPLTAWVRLANRTVEKPVVLMLDQFEQFLINRGGLADPLRKELAALVLGNLDVRVVLSLREEFLGGLEVFTEDIVTIYDSKFRLEHLRGKDAEEAIMHPAALRGGTVEADLVQALIADLQTNAAASLAAAAAAPGIETPFLQIVCKELWEIAEKELWEAADEGAPTVASQTKAPNSGRPAGTLAPVTLTLALYDARLGRHEKIIQRYIERLMQLYSTEERGAVAEVLRLLAPPGGVKQAWDARHLSDQTHVPIEQVNRILRYFSSGNAWVLRERLIGGNSWFELYHDALIRILSQWVEEQLAQKRDVERRKKEHEARRARRKRNFVVAAVVAVVVLMLVTAGILYQVISSRQEAAQKRQELYRLTEGDLDAGIKGVGDLDQDPTKRVAQLRLLQYLFTKSAGVTLGDISSASGNDMIVRRLNELKERFTAPVAMSVHTAYGHTRSATREDYINEARCQEPGANLSARSKIQAKKDSEEGSDIILLVHPALELDPDGLQCAWDMMGQFFHNSAFPILLPGRIIVRNDNVDAESIKVTFSGSEPLTIAVGSIHRHGAVVEQKELSEKLPELRLVVPVSGSTRLLDDERRHAWVLPRWTYPLLWARGIEVQPEEVAIMNQIMLAIIANQKVTLTPALVNYLIGQTRDYAPLTVSEALRARGGARDGTKDIRDILLALVEKQKSEEKGPGDQLHMIYAHLDYLLDHIAEYPIGKGPTTDSQSASARGDPQFIRPAARDEQVETSDDIAARILPGLRARAVGLVYIARLKLNGSSPPERVRDRNSGSERAEFLLRYNISRKYVEQATKIASPVTVPLAPDLVPCVVVDPNTQQKKLKPDVENAVETLRASIRKQFGVTPPGVGFQLDDTSDHGVFRIRIADGDIRETAKILATNADCFQPMINEIDKVLRQSKPMWLDTEAVDRALQILGGGAETMVRARYSLTDLKRLLRALLSTDPTQPSDAKDGDTVRDLPDLLASLVFWTKACPLEGSQGLDAQCLIRGLRRTQAARFGNGGNVEAGEVADALTPGVLKLAEPGGAQDAADQFAKALKTDRSAAMTQFPGIFATQLSEGAGQWWKDDCSVQPGAALRGIDLPADKKGYMDDAVKALGAGRVKVDLGPLKLCLLLSEDPGRMDSRMAAEVGKLLSESANSQWRPGDAAALAIVAMAAYRDFPESFSVAGGKLAMISKLFATAFEDWGKDGNRNEAEEAFGEAAGICDQPKIHGPLWCWSLLDEALTSYGRPNVIMAVKLAMSLQNRGGSREIRRARDLLESATPALNDIPPDDQSRMTAWLQFSKAGIDIALARHDDLRLLDEARALLGTLRDATKGDSWPPLDSIQELRVRLARLTEDEAVLEGMFRRPGDSTTLSEDRIKFLISRHEISEARDVTIKMRQGDADPAYWFWLSIIQYLSRDPLADLEKSIQEFAKSGHEYADYHRLLLFAASGRDPNDPSTANVRALVSDRWAQCQPDTWDARLAQGDMAPWREMLLGYYLGHYSFEQVSARIIDAEQFAASPFAATEESRAEYLTELFFYDAQLQSVTGDRLTRADRQMRSLRKALSSEGRLTHEYEMARYQLQELEGRR